MNIRQAITAAREQARDHGEPFYVAQRFRSNPRVFECRRAETFNNGHLNEVAPCIRIGPDTEPEILHDLSKGNFVPLNVARTR